MTIFLYLAIYLVIINYLIPESKKILKSSLVSLGFVLVLALRSPYNGLDVTGYTEGIGRESYLGVFLRISDYSFWDILFNSKSIQGHMETGWLIITKVCSLFTNDMQLFLCMIAVLQFIPITYVVSKYSKNIVLSFFIFACLGFYIRYFSGLRQTVAMSLILLAFDKLYNKQYKGFVIITLIASTIHKSSLFFLIMWPLSYFQASLSLSLFAIVITLLLTPFYNTIVPILLEIFFRSEYENYVDEGGQAITMFVVYSLFLLLSYLRQTKSRLMDLLRMLLLVGVMGQSLGVLSGGAITRIGLYFNLFLIFLLPEIVGSFNQRDERSFISVVATVLLCVFFVLSQPAGAGSSYVIPYQFFWENPVRW